MRAGLLLFIAALFLATPAHAEDMPFREDAGLTKAEYLLSAGKYAAALETVSDVLKRHPDNADAYTYRGFAYARLGQPSEAMKNYSIALRINPTHLGANKYLADLYLEKGDLARALEQLQVIRMTCGGTDCAEQDALESAIDQSRHSGDKKDAGK